MRIGIYGGSFNPIHIGHTSLAQSIIDQGLVDEVWLLVSPLNPLKRNDGDIADYDFRYKMAALACEDCHGIKVSDFETRLPIPSYTYNTLTALSETYPEHVFSLIVGADNWNSFHRWYKADEIKSNFDILVYRRPGYPIEDDVKIVDTPLFDISSTEIRDSLKDGACVSKWLSPKVLSFIQENNLYR